MCADTALGTLFDQFLKERKYLKNVTPRTLDYYEKCFRAFCSVTKEREPADLNRKTLQALAVGWRERGVSATTCNSYARGLNAFFVWLHAEGHISNPLRIPKQHTERKVVQTFSPAHLQAIITFKPRTRVASRAFTLTNVLIDTGVRIDEALTIRVADIDLDNLLVKVRGKGRKERIVPFSPALRRVLFQWLKKRRDPLKSDWLFPTGTGNRITPRNATRTHHAFLQRLGIPQSGFHRLRHTFATNYLRSGGDIVRLSRVLGHSQITTTMRYQHLQTEDLQRVHQQISLLERLGR
jgi:integrase/recombinase XerD